MILAHGPRLDGLSRARLCFEGDSNTDPNRADDTMGWVIQMFNALAVSHPSTINGGNIAVSGREWTHAVTSKAAFDALATEDGVSRINVCIIMMGVNDITNGSQTGAQTITRARDYLATSGGTWEHRVIAQIPRIDSGDAADAEAYNAGCLQMVIDGLADSCWVRPPILDGSDAAQYEDYRHFSQPTGFGTVAAHMLQHLKEVL